MPHLLSVMTVYDVFGSETMYYMIEIGSSIYLAFALSPKEIHCTVIKRAFWIWDST